MIEDFAPLKSSIRFKGIFLNLSCCRGSGTHTKMKFSYKNNWIWQRFTLKTCPRQVSSHCIEFVNMLPLEHEDHGNVCVFWTPFFFRLFPFTGGWSVASFAGRFWEIHCLSPRVSPRVGPNRKAQDIPHTFCIATLDRATLPSNKSLTELFFSHFEFSEI